MDNNVLKDVGNSVSKGQEGALKTFVRRRKDQAVKDGSSGASSTTPADAGAAATAGASPAARPMSGAPQGTPASVATPPDAPSTDGSKWSPDSNAPGTGGSEGPGSPGGAGTARSHPAAWRARRHGGARAGRRSSLMPGAAMPGTAGWGREVPGTRLLQGWRARGMSKAKRAALEEHLQQMAAHFAEVDAFELVEEDEDPLAAPTPAPPQSLPHTARTHRAAAAAAGSAPPGAPPTPAASELAAVTPVPSRLAAVTPGDAQQPGARASALLAATPASRVLPQPGISGTDEPSSSRSADTGARGGAPPSGGSAGAGAGRATRSATAVARGSALLAQTPCAASARNGASPSGITPESASDLLSDTPGSGSVASTPGSWRGPQAAPPQAAAAPADARRSSMAHGLLRRQTLLPAAALRPSEVALASADAAAAVASAAEQLRARQRMSSLSTLPQPLAGAGARGRLSSAAGEQPRLSLAAGAAARAGALGARRTSSLVPAEVPARRSSSVAGQRLSAAPRLSAAARDSLTGPLQAAAAAGPRLSVRDSLLGPGAAGAAAGARRSTRDSLLGLAGPAARRSAAAHAHALAAAGGASPGLGGLPGIVPEDEEEEAAAVEEEATEQLHKLLQAQLRLQEPGKPAAQEQGRLAGTAAVDEAEAAALEEELEEVVEAKEEQEDEAAEEEEEEESEQEGEPLSPLQQLLLVCGQGSDAAAIPSMEKLLGGLLNLKQTVKIGEGTYGEVFRGPPSAEYLDSVPEGDEAPASLVVKIIPMEGDLEFNGAPQKGAGDLMAEAVIALTLSGLRAEEAPGGERLHSVTSAFVRTCRVGVSRGRYPKVLVKAWKAWDKANKSENDPVEALPDGQLCCVLAMEEAGRDLEAYRLSGYHQARSVLLQVTLALAVGEEALGFEHRDLHWGNVLLRAAPSLTTRCRLRGMDISAQTQGVLATLIDFTASRLQTPGGDVAFCDLSADPELFEGPKGNVQADTYRRMLKLTRGAWASPFPATNTLWLHYVADIILTAKAPAGAGWRAGERRALRDFRRRALAYGSCQEAIWDELFQGLWVAQAAE